MTHDASDPNFSLAYQRLLALERFKSGFLARTSHELRSPINTIVSLHQLILEDLCEGPEEEKAFIAQSKDAALKMLALFDQITAVSKLDIGREKPRLETVDLSFLIPEVEMLTYLQAANQNIRYQIDTPAEEISIVTDPRWLKNILVSLVQDAIPQCKTLGLKVMDTAEQVAIVIRCDRPLEMLQADLDSISQVDNLPWQSASQQSAAHLNADIEAARTLPPVESLKLSTGLILASAQTALPLIQGKFAIAADGAAYTELRCEFPAA